MSAIEFTRDEQAILVKKIKQYFTNELEQDIAQFDAEFLLEFFAKEVGPYFYNRGVYDAQALVESKIDSITDSFYEIEKATDFIRK
jgi:uncharacterized protein (DUF2164 family)